MGATMARPDYCRFMPGKWRTSTLRMDLEQEGLLIRIAAFNMDAGVPLPTCRTTTARMLGVHHHKLRKVLDALIDMGEIVEDETGIYSARAIDEWKRASRQVTKQSTQELPEGYSGVTQELPHSYPIATPPVDTEKSEQFLRARRREEKREEENPSISFAQARAETAATDGRTDDEAECKAAFNGSTETLLAFVESAMGGHCRKNAAQWLANLTRINGSQAVAEAYQKFLTSKAEGTIIARPLPWLDATAKSCKRDAAKQVAPENPFAEQTKGVVRFAKPAPGSVRFNPEAVGNA